MKFYCLLENFFKEKLISRGYANFLALSGCFDFCFNYFAFYKNF